MFWLLMSTSRPNPHPPLPYGGFKSEWNGCQSLPTARQIQNFLLSHCSLCDSTMVSKVSIQRGGELLVQIFDIFVDQCFGFLESIFHNSWLPLSENIFSSGYNNIFFEKNNIFRDSAKTFAMMRSSVEPQSVSSSEKYFFNAMFIEIWLLEWGKPLFWNVLVLYGHCPNSFRPPPLCQTGKCGEKKCSKASL